MPSEPDHHDAAPATPAAEPWDPETAEALARSWEQAAAETEAAPAQPPRHGAGEPAEDGSRAWLDERIGNIAARLQQSLAGIKLDRAAAAFGARLDSFEARLDQALGQAQARTDFEGLQVIEAHIKEMDGQFEQMRTQLSRLDAIDDQLGELRRSLEQDRADGADAMELLVENAIERAADRFVKALPATAAPAPAATAEPATEALEAQLDAFMGERRRSEEETAEMLSRIEATLGRLVDRVEAIETAGATAPPAAVPAEEDPRADDDRLARAYAEGARALGQSMPSPTLHAGDYLPSDMLEEPARRAPQQLPPLEIAPLEHPAIDELRASAARAKLKADAGPSGQPSPAVVAAAKRARGRPSAEGRWRRSFFLISGMLLLGGTSYLAVDRYLSASAAQRAKGPVAAAPAPALRQAEASSQAKTQDKLSDAPPVTSVAVHPGAGPAAAEDEAPSADSLPATIAGPALRRAATGGDPTAEFEIGARFAEGRGVTADWRQAFAWYQRAAMRGYLPAQFRLAALYERGVGIEADVERAKVWYRRAAEQGHPKAMHNLAVLIIGGREDADFASAARWFKDAAERGLADSQYNLAILCEGGRGVARDLAEAYKWYALAARSGDQEAGRRVERLKSQMAPGEFARAERLLTGWKVKPREAASAGAPLPGT